jgi:hypothetical protein
VVFGSKRLGPSWLGCTAHRWRSAADDLAILACGDQVWAAGVHVAIGRTIDLVINVYHVLNYVGTRRKKGFSAGS